MTPLLSDIFVGIFVGSILPFLYLTCYSISAQGVLNYSLSKMPVNLVQYRGTVAVFNNRKFFNRL